jgi:hypothetical protein
MQMLTRNVRMTSNLHPSPRGVGWKRWNNQGEEESSSSRERRMRSTNKSCAPSVESVPPSSCYCAQALTILVSVVCIRFSLRTFTTLCACRSCARSLRPTMPAGQSSPGPARSAVTVALVHQSTLSVPRARRPILHYPTPSLSPSQVYYIASRIAMSEHRCQHNPIHSSSSRIRKDRTMAMGTDDRRCSRKPLLAPRPPLRR